MKSKASKGKGKGKSFGGGGSWVFMPTPAPVWGGYGGYGGYGGQPQIVIMPQMGGKGGGMGKSFNKGKGKGKGKGKSVQDERHNAAMDKLNKIEADRKVWVGGLEKETNWGKLEKHFKTLDCKPSMTEIMFKGTACLAFKTADEASNAIAVVNGSELGDKTIEVDVWTQKEKKEGDRPKKRERTEGVIKTGLKKKSGEQIKKDGKMEAKVLAKVEKVDDDCKVKVSGLPVKCDWKKLKEHFADNGCDVELACFTKPGAAIVTFKNADETSTALAAVNDTELDGKTVKVEVAV